MPKGTRSAVLLAFLAISSAHAQDVRKRTRPDIRGTTVASPEDLVDRCLERLGPLPVTARTHEQLVRVAERAGPFPWTASDLGADRRVADLLSFAVASPEFQFC